MLLDPARAIDVAATRLNYDDSFYDPAHQAIFGALLRLSAERPRGSIDVLTLSDALARSGQLENVGGATYLTELVSSVPTAANVERYVDIVHESAVLRRLIRSSTEVLERCFEPQEDFKELLDSVESEILTVTGLQSGATTHAVGDSSAAASKTASTASGAR